MQDITIQFQEPSGSTVVAPQPSLFHYLKSVLSHCKTSPYFLTKGIVHDFGNEKLSMVLWLAFDKTRNIIYGSNFSNHQIVVIDVSENGATSPIQIVGGAKRQSGYKEGKGHNAKFNYPRGVALTHDNSTLVIADADNHCIRVMDTATLTTSLLVGTPKKRGQFSHPHGICVGAKGSQYENSVFVCDRANTQIKMVDLTTKAVSTVAGSSHGDQLGPALECKFMYIWSICANPDNPSQLFVTDIDSHYLTMVDLSAGTVTQVLSLSSDVRGVHCVGEHLYLTSFDSSVLKVYSLQQKKMVQEFNLTSQLNTVHDVIVVPDRQLMYISGNTTVVKAV